jgi:tRNA pseudouridine38-40 synthase
MQSAHFKTFYKIQNKIKFIKTINFFLKKVDIVILNVKERSVTFHARHSAKKRTYKYLIINRLSPLILNKNRAWNLRKKLNIKIMKKGANMLIGTKNFSTFRASSCSAKSPIKTMEEVKIKKIGEKIEIKFVSKSFLQQQVRSMVGCLKYLGENKWTLKKFKEVIISKKRSNCAPPAPPHGLYLDKVDY